MRKYLSVYGFWVAHLVFALIAYRHFDFWLLAGGLLWSWLVIVIGQQIGGHRYFTHQSFEASKPVNILLNLMCVFGNAGTPQDWIIAHSLHHRKADTKDDPTNWRVHGLWVNYSSLWYLRVQVTNESVRLALRSMKDPVNAFFHRWYVAILIGWGLVLLCISPAAFGFFYLLPILCCHYVFNIINHVGHLCGTSNSRLLNVIFPGEGYHSNHHKKPTSHRFGDKDLLAWIIEQFLAKAVRP